MAGCTDTGVFASIAPADNKITRHRHLMTPDAGHALEILGHAIEYLTDEFVHENESHSEDIGRMQAIQLLMARNRQIYFACPVEHTLGERLRELTSRVLAFHR